MNQKVMWTAGLVALAVASMAGSAARADWLVTRDGGRLEIKGTYTAKGRLLVFTLPNGNLSSIRADQVDMEASRIATEEAVAAAEREATKALEGEEEKPRKKSIISLTDKDFKKAPAPSAEAGKEGAEKEKEAGTPGPAVSNSNVKVVGWERVPQEKTTTDGLEITGTVRNESSEKVTDVQVMANLYDEVGTLVGKISAQVTDPTLDPGEGSAIAVAAPGLFSFSAVRFDVQSRGFKVKPAAAPAEGSPTT